MEQPPIGIKPKWLNDENRIKEIIAGIDRYVCHARIVPAEWIQELNSILRSYNKHKEKMLTIEALDLVDKKPFG